MCIAVFLMLSELSTMTVGAVTLEQNEEYQEQETETKITEEELQDRVKESQRGMNKQFPPSAGTQV